MTTAFAVVLGTEPAAAALPTTPRSPQIAARYQVQGSPFQHVPQLFAAGLTVVPLVALTASAVGLTAAGLAGLRRRDIG